MDFAEFIAEKDDAGKRFDRIARRVVSQENLSAIYKEIRKGLLKLNGKKATPETRVAAGDKITIASFLVKNKLSGENGHENFSEQKEYETDIKNFPFPIIFKNEAILVIDKPYDISVHGGTESAKKNVAQIVAEFSKNQSLSFTPAPLHRLDRQTTGILVCSQNLQGARWFSEQLALRKIKKTYLALVEGIFEKPEIWNDTISAKDATNKFHTVSIGNGSATEKSAVTNVFPVSHGSYNGFPVSLVSCVIETGRKHQIRAQAAAHRHALLGDTAYGARACSLSSQNLFLHSWKISFPKNNLSVPEEMTATLPENFKKFLSQLLIEFS